MKDKYKSINLVATSSTAVMPITKLAADILDSDGYSVVSHSVFKDEEPPYALIVSILGIDKEQANV